MAVTVNSRAKLSEWNKAPTLVTNVTRRSVLGPAEDSGNGENPYAVVTRSVSRWDSNWPCCIGISPFWLKVVREKAEGLVGNELGSG